MLANVVTLFCEPVPLKLQLASASPNDRVAYTEGKSEFVVRVTEQAKRLYGNS